MRGWLDRNSQPLQAVGAMATAFAALTAVIVVPYQVSQSDLIQRDQTAREIYREFLNVTIQNPRLAAYDYCNPAEGTAEPPVSATSYVAYVDYLIYTAEQVVETSADGKQPLMASYLHHHLSYICSIDGPAARDPGVAHLLDELELECRGRTGCS